MNNLLADIPADLPEELITTILEASNLRVERIVSHGHASPEGFWYGQNQNECVILLKGLARLTIDGNVHPVDMKPGDFVTIPAHAKHRVEWTTPDEPTIWLAIHYGPPL